MIWPCRRFFVAFAVCVLCEFKVCYCFLWKGVFFSTLPKCRSCYCRYSYLFFAGKNSLCRCFCVYYLLQAKVTIVPHCFLRIVTKIFVYKVWRLQLCRYTMRKISPYEGSCHTFCGRASSRLSVALRSFLQTGNKLQAQCMAFSFKGSLSYFNSDFFSLPHQNFASVSKFHSCVWKNSSRQLQACTRRCLLKRYFSAKGNMCLLRSINIVFPSICKVLQ